MKNILCTYALAKCFADDGQDLLDTIFRLILKVMSEESKSILTIYNELNREFQIEGIPKLTIKLILKKASDKGYVKFTKNDQCSITPEGLKLKNELTDIRIVKESIFELTVDIQDYFRKNGIRDQSTDQIQDLLKGFIDVNNEPLIHYFNSENYHDHLTKRSTLDEWLIKYIRQNEQVKENQTKEEKDKQKRINEILDKMIKGSYIITAFRAKDEKRIEQFQGS